MSEQLFDLPGEQPRKERATNPMTAVYGAGSDGARCKDCQQLVCLACARPVYKCRLRTNTRSARTDHRLNWPACGKFEQRSGHMPIYDRR